MKSYRKSALALAGVWLAVAAAAAQPPADKPADNPAKGGRPARLIFDAEAGRQVPVYRLPADELVPSGRVRVAADGVDWGVLKMNAPEAHKTTRGKGVRVAVLDTGCDYSHPDFGGIPQERMKSFVPAQGPYDVQGHGTHCSGRVLARGTNYGVAPDAELWVGKVLDNEGSGAVTWIARGIDWATENGIDVVSLSVGGNSPDSYIPAALARAEAAGVIVVAAAGNDGPNPNTVDYPGAYKECVAVAALDSALNVATFSSRGPNVFAASPGVNVVSQFPGGRQAPMSGTSMATPHEAGAAALWLSVNQSVPRKERPAKYRAARAAAAIDLGPPGRDAAYGFGFVDLAKLVGTAAPPPPSGGFTGEVPVRIEFKDGKPVGVKLLSPQAQGAHLPGDKVTGRVYAVEFEPGRAVETGSLFRVHVEGGGPDWARSFHLGADYRDGKFPTWNGRKVPTNKELIGLLLENPDVVYDGSPDRTTYGVHTSGAFTAVPGAKRTPGAKADGLTFPLRP